MSIADKLTTIAENEQKVYDKGVEDGKKSEHDAFWDSYQNNGKRTGYTNAFSYLGWNDKTFHPKYDIIVSGYYSGGQMFHSCFITDLRQRLIDCGVTLDTSKLYPFNQVFQNARCTHLPKIDMSSATTGSNEYTFYTSYLKSIEELVVNENVIFGNTIFGTATSLTDITITGVIGRTLSMADCPLTVKSAKSVISSLKNYAGTDKELTYKLTLKNTVWTALNNAEAPPSGETWQEYVETLGWTYG